VREEGRYVSFLGWDDMEAVRGWKGHPEFKERMSRVQRFVDRFAPTELEVVARLQGEA
jgi:heme-degrading monooxygenase HmoA